MYFNPTTLNAQSALAISIKEETWLYTGLLTIMTNPCICNKVAYITDYSLIGLQQQIWEQSENC